MRKKERECNSQAISKAFRLMGKNKKKREKNLLIDLMVLLFFFIPVCGVLVGC